MVGAEIIILGNGPSLNTQRDLMPEVGKHHTFCCTRMYLWDGLCFTPTYYACNLELVHMGIEPQDPPFEKLKFAISFDGEISYGWYSYTKSPDEPISMDSEILRSGGTMPFIATQIAVRLGYKNIYYLGVEQTGRGHCFDPEGKVHPFIPHRPFKMTDRWSEMKELYEKNGITLRDCTPNGKLNEILGYKSLEEVLRDYIS